MFDRFFGLVAWIGLVAWVGACSQPSNTLATVGPHPLTIADLDAYLLTLPERERQVPPGEQTGQWMQEKLRDLALVHVLENSGQMAELQASVEVKAQRLWLRSSALVAGLSQELALEVAPSADEVATRAEALATERQIEPLLNFQHIYFRLDRAETPRMHDRLWAQAHAAVAEAAAGGDFAALAREFSDSAAAENGGLVVNARPSDLETKSRSALAALREDEVSPVVETRSGLHVFRLLRRLAPAPPSADQLTKAARAMLHRERSAAAHDALVQDLGERIETDVDAPSWRIGSWTLEPAVRGELLPDAAGAQQRERLWIHFLMAQEALDRGLETSEMTAGLSRAADQMLVNRVFDQHRKAFDAEISDARLEPFFDAQPALFNTSLNAHVELIFVPQGGDSYAAQQRAEALVADLRAGASFAEVARQHSRGPAADSGGDLGRLEPQEWARLGPSLGAAISELEVGQISDPIYCTDRVMTQDPRLLRGGLAILRVRDRTEARERSFEEAIDNVRRAFGLERRAELDQELQSQLLETAGFEVVRVPEPAELWQ